jgi:hypothetical protein
MDSNQIKAAFWLMLIVIIFLVQIFKHGKEAINDMVDYISVDYEKEKIIIFIIKYIIIIAVIACWIYIFIYFSGGDSYQNSYY